MAINFTNTGYINDVRAVKGKKGAITAKMTTSVKERGGEYVNRTVFVNLSAVKDFISENGKQNKHSWGKTYDLPLCEIEGFASPWYVDGKSGVNWIVTSIKLKENNLDTPEDIEDEDLPF